MLRSISMACALAVVALGTATPSRANEICSSEFQQVVQKHTAVMQSLSKLRPKGKPKTFEEAKAGAQMVCNGLAPGVQSFENLRKWVTDNKDFCQIPDKVVADVTAGLNNLRKNRAGACAAVSNLDKQKKLAEQRGAGDNLPANFRAGVIANDPFDPRVVRRPQIDLGPRS